MIEIGMIQWTQDGARYRVCLFANERQLMADHSLTVDQEGLDGLVAASVAAGVKVVPV